MKWKVNSNTSSRKSVQYETKFYKSIVFSLILNSRILKL